MIPICIQIGCSGLVVNKRYQLCKTHNWERMNPGKKFFDEQARKNGLVIEKMKKKQLLKPKKIYKKKIKFRTEKRSKEEREYSKKRKEHLCKNPFCKVCLDNKIETIATEVHHPKGRIGKLLVDETLFVSVCHIHHDWIGDHPELAKELGYSINRTT